MIPGSIYHQFSAKLPHHEFEEMEVDFDWNRSDDCGAISVKVQDGSNSWITFTLAELRALVELGEKFERAHTSMLVR